MSDFLFASPDFISGFARVVDLGGTFDVYNASESEIEADNKAIQNDWATVGKDMTSAVRNYSNGQK